MRVDDGGVMSSDEANDPTLDGGGGRSGSDLKAMKRVSPTDDSRRLKVHLSCDAAVVALCVEVIRDRCRSAFSSSKTTWCCWSRFFCWKGCGHVDRSRECGVENRYHKEEWMFETAVLAKKAWTRRS